MINPLLAEWEHLTNGIEESYIRSLFCYENKIFAGGKKIYISTNYGASWEKVYDGCTYTFCSFLSLNGIIYALTDNCGALVSYDKGATWVESNAGLTYKNYRNMVNVGNNIFIGGSNGDIFESTDSAKSWSLFAHIDNLSFLYANGTDIFAGTYGNGLLLSKDNGLTWDTLNNGIIDLSVSALLAKGNTLFRADGYTKIYQSDDYGKNWRVVYTHSKKVYIYDFKFLGNILFAGISDGLLLSTDDGKTWSHNINNADEVMDFVFSGDYIFTCNPDGIYRVPLSDYITSVEEHPIAEIFDVFPNVTSDFIYINCNLTNMDQMKIDLFNSFGQAVDTKTGFIQHLAHTKEQIDLSHLPAGVYFIVLSTGKINRTFKIMKI